MPNIKSAKKRVAVTKKAQELNNVVKTSMRTAIKAVEKADNKEVALEKSKVAYQRIDNAASKGVIKANTRDRYKQRVHKIVENK